MPPPEGPEGPRGVSVGSPSPPQLGVIRFCSPLPDFFLSNLTASFRLIDSNDVGVSLKLTSALSF